MGFRYIGNKTQILDNILAHIERLVPRGGRVADLMCGTGSVALALRRSGYQVTAADVMTFSYHHARVGLLFTSVPTFRGARNFINERLPKSDRRVSSDSPYTNILKVLNRVPQRKGYFWREFSLEGAPNHTNHPRNYFSPANATRIDGMRYWISKLRRESRINSLEHSLLLHDLIMAANDVANIAGTYGHYLSKLIGRSRSAIELKPTDVFIRSDSGNHIVLKGYAEGLAESIKCDLCYIDPPYMKRQYAANYHLLETLAREDCPTAIGVSGLRPWRDQYSNFCTKTKIFDSFRSIVTKMKCRKYLISYSEDGLIDIADLRKTFSEFGSTRVYRFKNKRFKSNNSKLPSSVTEYIIQLVI